MKHSLHDILRSATPAQIWSILAAFCAIVASAFSLGYWSKEYQGSVDAVLLETKFEFQISKLQQENAFLKGTQYTKVNETIDAIKSLHEREIINLEQKNRELKDLTLEHESRNNELRDDLQRYTNERLVQEREKLRELDEFQTTVGKCSPAVTGISGNVTINCEGLDSNALEFFNEVLDRQDLDLVESIEKSNEFAKRYNELKQELDKGRRVPAIGSP